MAGAKAPLTFRIFKGDQLIREERLSLSVIKLGKVPSAHLKLDDETVSRMHAIIEVNGTEHPLDPPGLVVGRGSEAEIRINDPGVSRRHAQFLITSAPGGAPEIEVHDMGSTNGIRVDGQKVARARLRDGSRVQIGHTSLILHLRREGASGV